MGLAFMQLLVAHNKPSENFSIDFELINGLIVIEASVNSKKGNFILDTGCSFLAVAGKHSNGSIDLVTTDFQVKASEVNIDKFELGLIQEIGVQAVQFNMDKINQLVDRDIDGLIGTQIISDYNLMIDYNQNKVVFISDRAELNSFDPFEFVITKSQIKHNGDQSFIDVQIGGEQLNMLLDSGANISVLDLKWQDQFKALSKRNNNSSISNDFTIHQSSINNVSITDLGVVYRDLSSVQGSMPYDGILSLSSLNVDKVLFDYQQNQVIFFWTKGDITSLD